MADKRPTELTTEETTLRGFVHSDDATNGSRKFNLARIGNALALRASRPQVISDGSTTNRAMRFTPGSRGELAGASEATWAGFVAVPASDPSTTAVIFAKAAATSSNPGNQDNSLYAGITTVGGLRIAQAAATPLSNYRRFDYDTFRSVYSGQTVFLEVYLVSGTTNPVVYINGVNVSTSFTPSNNGSAPDWLSSGLVETYALNGYNWPSGDAPLGCWINAALTDADRTYWLTHGVPEEWIIRGGSMVNAYSSAGALLYGAADSNADPTNVGWSGGGAHSVQAGARTGGAGAYFLRRVHTSGSWRLVYGGPLTQRAGAKVKIEIWAKADTPVTAKIGFTNANTNASTLADVSIGTSWALLSAEVVFTVESTTTPLLSIGTISGVCSLDIDDGLIIQQGALGYPVVGPDRFIRDATRISPPIDGYMVGMRPLTTDADGWIRGRRTSSGYLQADTQLVGDGRGVTQVLMRSVSGGTASLGESAGSPATVVASLTLTAGVWTPCTILKSVISTGKLYAALGTATDVEVAVRTGPILSLV